jgi:predicted nicotinamide N-methyase
MLSQQQQQKERPRRPFTIAELGCGPGLPSLVAASTLPCEVIATDVDPLALELVSTAAKEQQLDTVVSTRVYDLIRAEWDGGWMDDVDLFLLSDVFESEAIARGASKLITQHILTKSTTQKVWVFAQSDRAQREVFMKAIQRHVNIDGWSAYEAFNPNDRLWCCDLDETRVDYG